MDGILSKLLSFPPHPPPPNPLTDYQYDVGIKKQIEIVKSLSKLALLQKTTSGEHALDVINPAINTVPYSFVLLANISVCSEGMEGLNMEKIWEKIKEFLHHFDSRQIRYIGNEFSAIVDVASNFARSINQPGIAVGPIIEALIRLDPEGTTLTSHHILLVNLVMESRKYDELDPLLDKFILYVPGCNKLPKPKHLCALSLSPSSYITPTSGLTTPLTYLEVLEYFISCGISSVGNRKWISALKHFECAITYPVKDAVSKPMVEAYKKWILTGIIRYGRLLSLPKSTSGTAIKVYHTLAKPYENLARTFESDDASKLKSEVELGENLWADDCNLGLVNEVLASFQKFQIRNLSRVYSRLSMVEVHELTTSAGPDGEQLSVTDTESLVLRMINEGELHATLSINTSGPSILTFSLNGPDIVETQVQQELLATKSRIDQLSQEIKVTDRNLIHDKEYIKYLQKQKKASKLEEGESEIQAVENVMNWNDMVEDEDIMGVY